MLKLIPEPDGRVAIYEYDTLLGRARDQAHAEDWAARWERSGFDLGALGWAIADVVWARLTPEERRSYSQPRPAQIERTDQAA